MTATASIIIPHYNDVANLMACLRSLGAPDALPPDAELIIADNGSTADLSGAVALLPKRGRIIHAADRGAFAARNAGAAAATGEILAFIDSDCVADPHWLERGCAAAARGGVVSGRIDVFPVDRARPTPSEAFELVFAFDNRRYVEEERFAVTASLFVRKVDFERVGGFRPLVSEDIDWCHRAVDAGLALSYHDDIVVAHPARPNFAELKRKWQRLGVQSYHLARTRPRGAVSWWLRSLLLPVSALAAAPRVMRSDKISGIEARVGALGVLFALRLYRFWQAQKLAVLQPLN